jgi:hypothetical protein
MATTAFAVQPVDTDASDPKPAALDAAIAALRRGHGEIGAAVDLAAEMLNAGEIGHGAFGDIAEQLLDRLRDASVRLAVLRIRKAAILAGTGLDRIETFRREVDAINQELAALAATAGSAAGRTARLSRAIELGGRLGARAAAFLA